MLADRECGRTPYIPALLIAEIDDLSRLVTDRVVPPGCQLVLPAIRRPCVAATLGRDLETERGIGDHIDPWRWRALPCVEDCHVFSPIGRETTETVEELQIGFCGDHIRLSPPRGRSRPWRYHGLGLPYALDLLG